MLSERIEGYKATGKFLSVMPARYKNDYPFLKEVDSLALANVQLNLQSAFRNCFSKSMKKKNGFPKFKSSKHILQTIRKAQLPSSMINILSCLKLVR